MSTHAPSGPPKSGPSRTGKANPNEWKFNRIFWSLLSAIVGPLLSGLVMLGIKTGAASSYATLILAFVLPCCWGSLLLHWALDGKNVSVWPDGGLFSGWLVSMAGFVFAIWISSAIAGNLLTAAFRGPFNDALTIFAEFVPVLFLLEAMMALGSTVIVLPIFLIGRIRRGSIGS